MPTPTTSLNFMSQIAKFQPRQVEAALALMKHKYLLYGGAASGGKSYFLRWIAVYLCMYYFQKYKQPVRVGIFCKDFTLVRDRHLTKIGFEFPEWLGTMNKADHEFTLAKMYGGGTIAFRNLDDPSKYLSSEFAAILIDELTENSKDIFDMLRMRLRWPKIPDTKFIGATNPGGPGHGWVKKLWILRDFEEETLDPAEFTFVSAKVDDNKFIDESYIKQLDSLPENLRRAYRDGDWNVFSGQYFTEFNLSRHVIEPFDEESSRWFHTLPSYAGLDYGYTNPSACLWGKVYDGVWYIYRELYGTQWTFEQLSGHIAMSEVPQLIYADPSIWAKKDAPTSGADRMRPLPLRRANNDRVNGWIYLHELLKQDKIKISRNCRNLIRTLPELVYDKNNNEDIDTTGVDHLADALRYLVNSHRNILPQKNVLTYSFQTPKMEKKNELDDLFAPVASSSSMIWKI